MAVASPYVKAATSGAAVLYPSPLLKIPLSYGFLCFIEWSRSRWTYNVARDARQSWRRLPIVNSWTAERQKDADVFTCRTLLQRDRGEIPDTPCRAEPTAAAPHLIRVTTRVNSEVSFKPEISFIPTRFLGRAFVILLCTRVSGHHDRLACETLVVRIILYLRVGLRVLCKLVQTRIII